MDREKAIEAIEGQVGCYTASWNEWSDKDLLKMYEFAMRFNWKNEREMEIEDYLYIGLNESEVDRIRNS